MTVVTILVQMWRQRFLSVSTWRKKPKGKKGEEAKEDEEEKQEEKAAPAAAAAATEDAGEDALIVSGVVAECDAMRKKGIATKE